MNSPKKFTDQIRFRELAMSSSFCSRIYAEVEEVGWENLVRLSEDLTILSFRIMDKKGRTHILELTLNKTYTRCPPSVSADVPYNINLEWSSNSRIRDVIQQFQMHVDKLQDFWSVLDDIDRSLWVTDPIHSNYAMSYRQIKVGNDCCIILSINVDNPRSLPECRFLGSDTKVNFLMDIWKWNCKKWTNDKSFPENLVHIFGTQLSQPQHAQKIEEQIECGICYAQYLPTDDELGDKSGTATDYACENGNCKQVFHTVCLGDWLLSITTTRRSFDVLFGNCPYCSDPIAVKISMKKKLVAQTPDYSKEEKATWRVPIGSRPPRCDRKCDSCSHCEAIQVPENPPRAENSSVVINGRDYGNSNYKPMSWKCKCGNLFFNP